MEFNGGTSHDEIKHKPRSTFIVARGNPWPSALNDSPIDLNPKHFMTSRFKEYGLAHENFETEDGLRLTKTKYCLHS